MQNLEAACVGRADRTAIASFDLNALPWRAANLKQVRKTHLGPGHSFARRTGAAVLRGSAAASANATVMVAVEANTKSARLTQNGCNESSSRVSSPAGGHH